MPVIAEKRDVESPRTLEVYCLTQSNTVAFALYRPSWNPDAAVVGIANKVVCQPPREFSPLELPIDLGATQRESGVAPVMTGKRIAQPDMDSAAFLAHEAAKATRKPVIEPEQAPDHIESLTQMQSRQGDIESIKEAGTTAGDMGENEIVLVVAQYVTQGHLDST